ncbi:hypothetical protein [Leptospirillum ferriphilum]|jgi:hypothetical protein|uniref:hypothetical protein n=1 Tax=Leptospirillum ferriphilum TaxID=178606 RepID=UPI001EF0949A|nr:hypothetical protein [Leptospirillum ferriphilum]
MTRREAVGKSFGADNPVIPGSGWFPGGAPDGEERFGSGDGSGVVGMGVVAGEGDNGEGMTDIPP